MDCVNVLEISVPGGTGLVVSRMHEFDDMYEVEG